VPRRSPRRATGRASLLTRDLAAAVVALVEAGNYLTTAAAACGIAESTLHQWLAQGRDASVRRDAGIQLTLQAELYAEFAESLTRARARAETTAVAVVRQAMTGGYVVREEPLLSPDGTPARDEDGQVLMKREYARPDGKLAMAYLSATAPRRWSHGVQRLQIVTDDLGLESEAPTAPGMTPIAVLAARLHEHVQRRAAEQAAGPAAAGSP
jgi:hypothetical protein